jgi:hypothetical protein
MAFRKSAALLRGNTRRGQGVENLSTVCRMVTKKLMKTAWAWEGDPALRSFSVTRTASVENICCEDYCDGRHERETTDKPTVHNRSLWECA